MSKRNKKGRDIDGVLILDKATGQSSNHALQEIKRLFGANKAGHTGSLDPLASGLLPICLGQSTKWHNFYLTMISDILSRESLVKSVILETQRENQYVQIYKRS